MGSSSPQLSALANHPFHPSLHAGHSRSSSASSTHSFSSNRPPSSHAAAQSFRQSPVISQDDLYRHTHGFTFPPPSSDHHHHFSHTRNSSTASTHSTSFSFPGSAPSALTTPNDSPPAFSHSATTDPATLAAAAALKSTGTTNIRRLRTGMSPYPRDHSLSGSESVRSSSSEAEDYNSIFLPQSHHHPHHHPHHPHHQHHHPTEYSTMYNIAPHPATGAPLHQLHPSMASAQEAANAAGAFGRMTLDPEHALEQLASNVRTATTTSASDRAKQIFVQAWLNANYAPYPDGNVPRQGLYNSYRRVCEEHRIPHINTATLGKAIRLCFPTIKTRRLGVRGNSKYHYCGIRPATSSEASWLQDFIRRTSNQKVTGAASRESPSSEHAGQSSSAASEDDGDEDNDSEGASSGDNIGQRLRASGGPGTSNSLIIGGGLKSPTLFMMDEKTPTTNTLLSAAQGTARFPSSTDPYSSHAAIRSNRRTNSGGNPIPGPAPTALAGDTPPLVSAPTNGSAAPYITPSPHQPLSIRQLPNFPSIDEALGPSSSASSPHGLAAREVWRWFEDHLDGLLESVRAFRFDQFEIHLRTFWASLSGDHREVVHAPAVAGLMAKADALLYDEILETLRSQMLAPIPPQALTSLRQLADKMEKILLLALENYGNTFVEPKVELGARFGHLVLRFLDIHQVTQALNSVLSNPKQLADMRRSWREIDFESVRNQSALVCNCRHEDLVSLLEVDFVALLDNLQNTAEPVRDIMAWADNCCDRLMGGSSGAPGEERATMSSRSVLIRWGYVTSQIMRDLTIRSDPAFGAFQILKLFLDDWVALNVLRSVALSTNSVAASVEPLMQQQFLSLSPMPGQEFTGTSLDTRPSNPGGPLIPDTPTTSSMLAALTQPFGPDSQLDGANSQFGQNSYMSMSYGGLDNSSSSMGNMPFGDFSGPGGAGFDMSSFTQDLNLGPSGNADNAGSPHSTHSANATDAGAATSTGNTTESAVTKEDDSM